MTYERPATPPAAQQTSGTRVEPQQESRLPYQRPQIVHEMRLEARAGSPLGQPGITNPLDPRPNK